MSDYQDSVTCTPGGPYVSNNLYLMSRVADDRDDENGINERGRYILQRSEQLRGDPHAIFRWLERQILTAPKSYSALTICWKNIRARRIISRYRWDRVFDTSFAKWSRWWESVKETDGKISFHLLIFVVLRRLLRILTHQSVELFYGIHSVLNIPTCVPQTQQDITCPNLPLSGCSYRKSMALVSWSVFGALRIFTRIKWSTFSYSVCVFNIEFDDSLYLIRPPGSSLPSRH
jgi:hypothetical protein